MNYNQDLTHPDTKELQRLHSIANKVCPVCGSDLEGTALIDKDLYIVACSNNKNKKESKCAFYVKREAFIRISKQYGSKED